MDICCLIPWAFAPEATPGAYLLLTYLMDVSRETVTSS